MNMMKTNKSTLSIEIDDIDVNLKYDGSPRDLLEGIAMFIVRIATKKRLTPESVLELLRRDVEKVAKQKAEVMRADWG